MQKLRRPHGASRVISVNRKQRRAANQRPETVGPLRRQFVEEALRHHQAGRLDQAKKLYLKELKFDPDNADALHFLGLLHYQQGDPLQASELIRKALATKPSYAEAHSNLGVALAALGKSDEAIAAYRRAIAIKPDFAEAHNNLGNALAALGKADDAVIAYRSSIAIKPDYADAQHNLGNALTALGKTEDAMAAYRRAVAIKPDFPEAHYNLGNALVKLAKTDEAVATYRRAIAIKPDYADAHDALATALKDANKLDQAADCLRHAITINANVAHWHNNLGFVLKALGKPDEAVGAYHRAIAIKPDYAEAHNNLGIALAALGKVDEAVVAYRRAIAIKPDYADAHGGLSVCLLSLGDLLQGFEEYRWRWKVADFPEKMPTLSCPLWEGEDPSGKDILVYCEQGYGDSIQFVRYIAPLSRNAVRVTVLADQPLVSLFRSIPGIEVPFPCVYDGDEYDYHVPLMCLPRLFGTTLDTIPADVPYLSADPIKVKRWTERLSRYEGKIKIGLVWAGSPRKHDPESNAIDRRRSITLQQFAPLAGMANVQFFSLQKGEPATQALHPPHGMSLVDWTSELDDFEDTAALMTNLDLVISVDTSVVHLAGALAKPVWVLSRFDGCWRWLNGREDSPWYPTARVFHQKAPGAWNEVIERVAAELVSCRTQARLPGKKSPHQNYQRCRHCLPKVWRCIKRVDWQTRNGFITKFSQCSPVILTACTCSVSLCISAAIMRQRSIK